LPAAATASSVSPETIPVPDRSPDYLAWILTLGCIVCARASGGATVVEAAHTNALGPRGLGQRTSDFSAIPLCVGHHRENADSYHRLGELCFVRQHSIDLHHVAAGLKQVFDRSSWPACQRSDDDSGVTNFPSAGILGDGAMTGSHNPRELAVGTHEVGRPKRSPAASGRKDMG